MYSYICTIASQHPFHVIILLLKNLYVLVILVFVWPLHKEVTHMYQKFLIEFFSTIKMFYVLMFAFFFFFFFFFL